MSAFGTVLRKLRKQDGLTQSDLGKALGISYSTVSMYEHGEREPDFEMLEIIADYFNVSMDFLHGKETENSQKAVYQRIKMLRIQRGMSQQELAELIGYKTASAINKIELGLRDINQSKILDLAKALGTTPSYLMGWEEAEKSHDTVSTDSEREKKYEVICDMFYNLSDKNTELAIKGLQYIVNIPEDKLPEAVRYLKYLADSE